MYEAPKPPAASDRKRRRLACRRAFPWKPQQVRALTGRGVEAQLAETKGGGGGGGGWRQRNEVNAKKAVTLNSLRLKISSAGFSVRAPESRSRLLMIIQRKQRARHHVHAPDSKVSTFLLQARLTQNR